MKLLEKLRTEGPKAFANSNDPRWDELVELKADLDRANKNYDALCALKPDFKWRYREQLKDTEWVIEQALERLMEGDR